jgi:hypothetical protein
MVVAIQVRMQDRLRSSGAERCLPGIHGVSSYIVTKEFLNKLLPSMGKGIFFFYMEKGICQDWSNFFSTVAGW